MSKYHIYTVHDDVMPTPSYDFRGSITRKKIDDATQASLPYLQQEPYEGEEEGPLGLVAIEQRSTVKHRVTQHLTSSDDEFFKSDDGGDEEAFFRPSLLRQLAGVSNVEITSYGFRVRRT